MNTLKALRIWSPAMPCGGRAAHMFPMQPSSVRRARRASETSRLSTAQAKHRAGPRQLYVPAAFPFADDDPTYSALWNERIPDGTAHTRLTR